MAIVVNVETKNIKKNTLHPLLLILTRSCSSQISYDWFNNRKTFVKSHSSFLASVMDRNGIVMHVGLSFVFVCLNFYTRTRIVELIIFRYQQFL